MATLRAVLTIISLIKDFLVLLTHAAYEGNLKQVRERLQIISKEVRETKNTTNLERAFSGRKPIELPTDTKPT